jgi:hypothetical protein
MSGGGQSLNPRRGPGRRLRAVPTDTAFTWAKARKLLLIK